MAGSGSESLNIDITADAKAASKEIDALQKDVDKLEKSKPEIEVDADTSGAAKALDGVEKQAHQLSTSDFEITVQAKVDKVLGAFDEVAAKAKDTAVAADALGRALGPELAAKADTTAIVGELEKAGLTLDEIGANADQLGSKLKELADADVGGKMGASLGTARGKLDELGESANSSKSVLANMVGNSVQDVSALGGVAGSAGVALGQMGEYMADALGSGEKLGSVLTNFATVAGPVAALSVGIALATKAFAAMSRQGEETAKKTAEMTQRLLDQSGALDKLKDKLDPAADAYDAFASALDEGDFQRATAALGVLNGNVGDLGETIAGIRKPGNDFMQSLLEQGGVTKEYSKILADAINQGEGMSDISNKISAAYVDQGVDATTAAAKTKEVVAQYRAQILAGEELDDQAQNNNLDKVATQQLNIAKATDPATKAMVEQAEAETQGQSATETYVRFLQLLTGATKEAAAALLASQTRFAAAGDSLSQWADDTAKAVTGMQAFADATHGQDWGKAGLDGAVTAMSAFTEQHNALIDINADSQKAVDDFTQSIKDNGKSFDVSTEKGRANQSALEDVASTIDTKLAAAYKDSGGDMDVFKEKSQAISDDAIKALMPALKGSGISAQDLAAKLGLLPEDIETRYKLSGDEEAKIKLGFLQGAIENLPEDVQTTVTQKIIAGDYQGALATVQNYYNRNPAVVPVVYAPTKDLAHFRVTEQGGTIGPNEMGIAGEAGPEFVKLPGKPTVLIDGAMVIPPGTRVTSVRKTRQILSRRPKRFANGTSQPAVVSAGASPMTFQFIQQAPIYGVADLDRHLERWSNQLAQKISVGKR